MWLKAQSMCTLAQGSLTPTEMAQIYLTTTGMAQTYSDSVPLPECILQASLLVWRQYGATWAC